MDKKPVEVPPDTLVLVTLPLGTLDLMLAAVAEIVPYNRAKVVIAQVQAAVANALNPQPASKPAGNESAGDEPKQEAEQC